MLLHEDAAFISRMQATLREAGLMFEPVFDSASSQLVEGGLHIDLLNVWHETRQLTRPETPRIIQVWASPPSLAEACYFGRVDVVRGYVARGELGGGEDGIDAAIGAFCVTPLHVECVRMLLEAGVAVTQRHFETLGAESVGSALDGEMSALLRKYAR